MVWNGAHGTHVGRPVLANDAIAARGPDHEATMLVGKRHRQAVNLEFTDVREGRDGQDILGTFIPGIQFLFAARVGQAEHGYRMAVLWHLLCRLRAYALRR